jgi:small subunit ribosomal protein S9
MATRFYYAVGRRKTASAQVRIYPGEGKIVINDKPLEEYFTRPVDLVTVMAPLKAAGMEDKVNITVVVRGGGISGQAGAVAHGIARALSIMDEDLRPVMRKVGFLTRDARMKERKKYGLKRARKAPQYTKR